MQAPVSIIIEAKRKGRLARRAPGVIEKSFYLGQSIVKSAKSHYHYYAFRSGWNGSCVVGILYTFTFIYILFHVCCVCSIVKGLLHEFGYKVNDDNDDDGEYW